MKIDANLTNKNILIWGFGREGKSTFEYLKKSKINSRIEIFEGNELDIDFDKYDLVIKSPGIKVSRKRDNITSQTKIILDAYREKVIGITGTKGKTTTSYLMAHVLEKLGENVVLVGNMGKPAFDYIDKIEKCKFIIYEMSCHQLNDLDVSPHIAIYLNLFEEHLDYYDTFDNYKKSKSNITYYQDEKDYLVAGENVPFINTKAKTHTIKWNELEKIDLKLLGRHNLYNSNFVLYTLSNILNYNKNKVIEAISSFDAIEHRLEYVGNYSGIHFYNDSISTIPEATILAIEAVSNVQSIIIGGMDRGINYNNLINYIRKNIYNYILISDSGKRIYNDVKELEYCYYFDKLEEAVIFSKKITKKNMACILSPAAPSYNDFKNFEERGKIFKELVRSA